MPKVIKEIKRVMPRGTRDIAILKDRGFGKKKDRWKLFPSWPPDAFAVAAHLVKTTGAYQYANFNRNLRTNGDPFEIYAKNRPNLEKIGAAWANAIPIPELRDDTDVAELSEQSAKKFHWLKLDAEEIAKVTEDDIQNIWEQLIPAENDYNMEGLPEFGGDIPSWWKYAIQLMILSDQASKGLGFSPSPSADTTFTMMQVLLTSSMALQKPDSYDRIFEMLAINNLAQPELVDTKCFAVMPKCRTPNVGWTLRSLTHNLAFMPVGEVRARWYHNVVSPESASGPNGTPLNVLVVPFPFYIKSEAFETTKTQGEFSLNQSWLKDLQARHEIIRLVDSLIYEAYDDGIPVNAVIFPEMSLDYVTFDWLSSKLAREHPKDFEFIMAGLADRVVEDGNTKQLVRQHGNFVGVRGRLRGWAKGNSNTGANIPVANDGRVNWDYQSVRSKHHRWKIDDRQARRYGIRHRFVNGTRWWEGIAIGSRRVDVFEPRKGLTMTPLICEDLARSDPCQDVIRAIGPNLVVALLMDGPQIGRRWPAHYAGVLADDPGSSVLTVDSFGLINRAADCGDKSSRSVVFWKDCMGDEQEIEISPAHRGLLLSLTAEKFEEVTLDGRTDGGVAGAWRLSQVTPLTGRSDLKIADW